MDVPNKGFQGNEDVGKCANMIKHVQICTNVFLDMGLLQRINLQNRSRILLQVEKHAPSPGLRIHTKLKQKSMETYETISSGFREMF